MRTISQVAALTGISVHTLQYYDEIRLLKPSKRTQSGCRLYDDEALQKLQQILFFKELGFKLKDIREIIESFDMFIQKIKDDESEAAKLAITQLDSIEEYTKAMKHNMEHFSD